MIRKVRRFAAICIFLAAMALGIVKKQTYTDLTKQEDFLSQIPVAELPENFAESQYTQLRQELPDSKVILRVRVMGDIEYLYTWYRQKAVIQEVYAGTGVEPGEEVYLISSHWDVNLFKESVHSLERGFVNILEAGAEYLVFAEDIMEDWDTGISMVRLYDDFILVPVFCYEEHPHVIVPILEDADNTYVPYGEVKDNEFFVTSEKGLQALQTLKNEMLALYPRDEID